MNPAYCLFETPIGRCGIVWRGETVIGTAIADASVERVVESIRRRFPGVEEAAPPRQVEEGIAAIVRLLDGEDEDFSSVAFDIRALPEFERKVLEAVFAIPRGETRTYGEIAAAVGSPGAARAVGRALGANPVPIIIPCHRVLAAGGRSGGFSAPGGARTKMKMLEIEGARRGEEPGLFDELPWSLKA